ncbi:MAG: hypothetical protein NTV88_02210 [Candidatus Micrarchaeota archaeon]|nr:hypothetical protein [Candidatus Micrarchaeota archaeon]
MELHRLTIFAIALSIFLLAGCTGETQQQENTDNWQTQSCPASCDDSNSCTVDFCADYQCIHRNLDGPQPGCMVFYSNSCTQETCSTGICILDYQPPECATDTDCNSGLTCEGAGKCSATCVNESSQPVPDNTPPPPEQQNIDPPAQTINQGTQTQSKCQPEHPLQKDYNWQYGGKDYSLTLCYAEVGIDTWRSRDRQRNYANFVDDPYSAASVDLLSNDLDGLASNEGFSQYQKVNFMIAFVQGLPYTSDLVTTGFDDYPRFPYETLYDNGGDCEDTAILTAALLKKMGYGVILLNPPKHVAVGVKCTPDDFTYPVTYYTYEGQQYCYLETTGENWKIGQIPPAYSGVSVKVIPIYNSHPDMKLDPYKYAYSYDRDNTYVDVTGLKVKNVGTGTAKNVKIYVALQTVDTTKVWDQYTLSAGDISVDGSYSGSVTNLHAPTGQSFRVQVIVYGDNFNKVETASGWFTWS